MKHLPLFDEPEPAKDDDLWIADSDWREAPQNTFLSWPPDQQARYQAARDLDSALYETDPWWTRFFAKRAETWKKED